MEFRRYTRHEYLEWCKENNVKKPLPESVRNIMTISGYPTYPYDSNY